MCRGASLGVVQPDWRSVMRSDGLCADGFGFDHWGTLPRVATPRWTGHVLWGMAENRRAGVRIVSATSELKEMIPAKEIMENRRVFL